MQDPSKLSISELWSLDKLEGRFNDWGERKWLSFENLDVATEAASTVAQLRLSERASDLYWHALATDSKGIEFVVFSDAELPAPLDIAYDGSLVPCFLPFNLEALESDNRQSAMSKRGVFIYDGWIPISDWQPEELKLYVTFLDSLVSAFSVVGRYHAYWEPKYHYYSQPTATQMLFPSDIQAINISLDILSQLPEEDRMAISRSLAWMSNALKDKSVAKFLLLFLSIESLATYIESDKNREQSILRQAFSDTLPSEDERNRDRDNCIESILANGEWTASKVQDAFFECISQSIKRKLVSHLDEMFEDDSISSVMFGEKVKGKTLWDLRNRIAHGSLNLLNEEEVRFIDYRVGALEEIARSYFRQIFRRLVDNDYFPQEREAIRHISPVQGIGGPGTSFSGPTEMAEYYLYIAKV